MMLTFLTQALRYNRRQVFLSVSVSCYTTFDAKVKIVMSLKKRVLGLELLLIINMITNEI